MRINNSGMLITTNNMNKNTRLQGKSMQKLSTGLKINKASDNAAGLSISEKMRARIRGLEQANRNVQDGISLIQVAESAMEEIHNILGRMNELAVQCANGTLEDGDRQKINIEIENLKNEITHITENTNFNGVKVLQGNKEVIKEVEFNTTGVMPSWVNIPSQLDNPKLLPPLSDSIEKKYAYATIDFSAIDSGNGKIDDLLGNGFFSTCCTCTKTYNIKFVNTTPNPPTGSSNIVIEVDISNVKNSEELVKAIMDQSSTPLDHFTQFMVDPNNPGALIIYDNRANQKPYPSTGNGVIAPGIATGKVETIIPPDPDINIQYADGSDTYLQIHLPNTSLKNIGIDSINLSTQKNAENVISSIQNGINYISCERSKMGAYSNTLETRYSVNSINIENETASESLIRDVDIARETLDFSKINILLQASQAILSQVKQQEQNVLTLLN